MTIRTLILLSILCTVFLPLICNAKVDYISIHEIESSVKQPFSAKFNIVEKHQENQLKFILNNQNKETLLKYKRINKYMLRLTSPHYIVGEASVSVYELEQSTWQKAHTINISNSLTATKIKKSSIANVSEIEAHCQLTRQPKETLWSIASRYKKEWDVDVFSAMLAIYKSNLSKFAKHHIGRLIEDGDLVCPSSQVLSNMGEKAKMKAEFNRLNSQ